MIVTAASAITVKIASWILIRLVRRMSGPLVQVVRQRSAGCRAVYGLGIWPMVRPHCISSSVRLPSHRVPVKKP